MTQYRLNLLGLKCIALVLLFSFTGVDMDNGPHNSAVLVGSEISLLCRDSLINSTSSKQSGSQVFWRRRIPRSSADIKISGQSERISMNKTCDGQYDLIIRNATLKDAGTYICILTLSGQYTAQVVVLDDGPICYMSHNDTDDIFLRCTVQFSGNWHPKMEWRTMSGQEVPSNTTVTYNLGVASLTSTVERSTITASSSAVQFVCNIFFDAYYFPNPDHLSTDAKNIPTFRQKWVSPATEDGGATIDADENDKKTNSNNENRNLSNILVVASCITGFFILTVIVTITISCKIASKCNQYNHSMNMVTAQCPNAIETIHTSDHIEDLQIDSGNVTSDYEEIIEEPDPIETTGIGDIQLGVFRPGKVRGEPIIESCYLNMAKNEPEYQNESNRTEKDQKRIQTNYSILECRTRETPQPPTEYQKVERKAKREVR